MSVFVGGHWIAEGFNQNTHTDPLESNPQQAVDKTEVVSDQPFKFLSAGPEEANRPEIVGEKAKEESNPFRIWGYVLLFVAFFIMNYLTDPGNAIVTLISSITQAVVLLAVVGLFLGIKRLFKRDK